MIPEQQENWSLKILGNMILRTIKHFVCPIVRIQQVSMEVNNYINNINKKSISKINLIDMDPLKIKIQKRKNLSIAKVDHLLE